MTCSILFHWQLCIRTTGVTACELIIVLGSRGCYAHTSAVFKGNGVNRHFCRLVGDEKSAGYSNQMSTGSISITLYGLGFGNLDFSMAFRGSLTACEATQWVSMSSLGCRAAAGLHRTGRWTSVTAGERTGSLTQSYLVSVHSYDAASASGILRASALGSFLLFTVHGTRLGTLAFTTNTRQGSTGCEATEWASDTSVGCKAGPGAVGSRRLVMTVGEGSGSMSEAWSTLGPALQAIYFAGSWMDGFCVDHSGWDVNAGVLFLGQLSGDLSSQQLACWQVKHYHLFCLMCTQCKTPFLNDVFDSISLAVVHSNDGSHGM